jgi:hypothetical protein
MFKGASGFHAGDSGGGGGGDGIYGGSGSVPTSVTATIFDTLTFSGGDVIMAGTDKIGFGGGVTDTIYLTGGGILQIESGGTIHLEVGGDLTTNSSSLEFRQGGAFFGLLTTDTPTADRTFTLPDASGTIALVGGAGIDGIYGGSGSLGGDTVVTMAINKLQFDSTTQTGLLTIDASTDSVGIGTDTPTGTLELSAPNAVDNVTFELSELGTRKWFIETDFNTSGEPVHFKNNAGNHLMSFLSTTREVGIGTSGPTSILHIAAPQSVGDEANATTIILTNTSTGTDQTSDIRLSQRTGDYESGMLRGGREADYSIGSRDGYLSFLTGKDDGGGTVVLTQTMYMGSAGNIGIGSGFTPAALPDASALLDMSLTTTQGLLPPKMTNAQMIAIVTPATGLMVYDTDNDQWMGYNNTDWVILG